MKLSDPRGYIPSYADSAFLAVTIPVAPNDEAAVHTYRRCREEFAGYFLQDSKAIGYCLHKGINPNGFAKLWSEIETRAEIKNSKTVIHPTPWEEKVVFLEIDPFWTVNTTRRGFCTLFLRGAACFSTSKDIEEAIGKYALAYQIKAALMHFLSGRTTPTYDGPDINNAGGVVGYFSSRLSKSNLDKHLVKIITE